MAINSITRNTPVAGSIASLVAITLSPHGVYIEKSALLDLTRRLYEANGRLFLSEADFEICLQGMQGRNDLGFVARNGSQWVYLTDSGMAHYQVSEKIRDDVRKGLTNRALEHLRNYCNNI